MKKRALTQAIEIELGKVYLEEQQKQQLARARAAAAERASRRLQQQGGKLNVVTLPYKPAAEKIYEGDPALLAQVHDIISGNLVAAALAH